MTLAGCRRFTQSNGTTFCGTHINTGAESVLFDSLNPGISAPLPNAPATSDLPPPVPAGQLPGRADYIRTSPDCGHGAIVVVSPADAAALVMTVPSRDGLIAGIGLVAVTEPVTVAAWVSGRYEGGLVLSPPLPAPTRS